MLIEQQEGETEDEAVFDNFDIANFVGMVIFQTIYGGLMYAWGVRTARRGR